MYAFIRGKLVKLELDHAIVDVGGVGYLINTPLSLFTQGASEGNEIFLYTSFIVREDSQRLFGFESLADKELFEKLLKVSGLGPKTALAIVGQGDTMNLEEVILMRDVVALTRIPGIGKKSAERIITELSDQMTARHIKGKDPVSNDAIAALVTLGYKEKQAFDLVQKAMKKNPKQADLSSLIALSLEK